LPDDTKTDESTFPIPEADFDVKSETPRAMVALAIEAAKAAHELGAQQVITNMRRRFGPLLVPPALDQRGPVLPPNAIPFHLEYAEGGNDAGMPIPAGMDLDASDEVILDNFLTLQQWGQEWFSNMGRNGGVIYDDFARRGDLIQAHTLDISRVKNPRLAVICGSGSSLDDLTRFLPSFPGLVICGPSNASAVVAAGRHPDAILALDSGFGTVHHLSYVPYDALGVPLVTPTAMNPDAVALFPNTRKWFTSIIQMQQGANHPFNVFSHMLFPMIRDMMYQAGCAVNGEILLLNLLQEMSIIPQFDAVFLLGVDFAYKQHASRCKTFVLQPDGHFDAHDVNSPRDTIITNSQILRAANGYVCDESMLIYKRSLLTAWVITKLPLFDCSDGIITEVPRVDFQKLAEGGFRSLPPAYDFQLVLDSYNGYLTKIGYEPGKAPGTEGRPISGELW
jgi:hypothetical protein